MKRSSFRIWLAAACFITVLLLASGLELARSYRIALQLAYKEADLSGYLISEWISESFAGIEYVLKDTLHGFDEETIPFATRSAAENGAINGRMAQKAEFYDNIIFIGLFDSACVIQHGSIQAIIGDSSADLGREYCTEVMKPPVEQMKLSGFFVSSTGAMNVSATYPLTNEAGEVVGFALAALDLSFFQRWLDKVKTPDITISIMDADQFLLARKPSSRKLGEKVQDARLKEFIESDKNTVSFRRISPVDEIERIWSLRKIGSLPLVVAVGYSLENVLESWRSKVAAYATINILFIVITIMLALAYNKNRKNAEMMESLAMVDPLTGLMNRRSFTKIVKLSQEQATAPGKEASFIMVDVDYFKKINDVHGHDGGDLILTGLARELRASFRASDIICRWGGEEFLVYLADTDMATAKSLADRLKHRLAARTFIENANITVSQGISSLTVDSTIEGAIREADERLYEAKASGRNCHRPA